MMLTVSESGDFSGGPLVKTSLSEGSKSLIPGCPPAKSNNAHASQAKNQNIKKEAIL